MTITDGQSNEPNTHSFALADITLSYNERHPELKGQGPTLLFAHATGFHARVWDQLIRHLPPMHTVCLNQRGHGQTPGGIIKNWRVFGQDLQQFVTALDLTNIVGIGHSMGGHAMVQASSLDQQRYQRIVIIDPVIIAPEIAKHVPSDHTWLSTEGDIPHPTAKRKRDFDSTEEMYARFKDRSPYSLFNPQSLWDYCHYGLRPDPDSDRWLLACSPETEASIYLTATSNPDIYNCIEALDIPVLLLRAKPGDNADIMDFASSPTWPDLVNQFRRAREIYRPDLTHFMPMQAPAEMADIILSEVNND